MGGEWRPTTWGDEISLEYGKALRGYADVVGQYRVYGSNGPIGWTHEALAPGPGVILGRKGAYRGVRYSTEPFYVIDTAYYVRPRNEFDTRWLYYAIIHHKLGEIDDGSPIPSTTRSAVYVRDFDVPPLPEQRAIASILGALDDKIELNRRMNETLEGMARALFKDWFIDFGPVRAKANGGAPYLADDLWALFPDALGDDGLPLGWEVGTIQNFCLKVSNGGTPKRDVLAYWENGDIPWLTSGEVRQPFIIETSSFISESGYESSSAKWVQPDATVVALYGATAGEVSLVCKALTTNQAVCALTPSVYARYFVYLKLRMSTAEMASMATGSAQQNLSRALVEKYPTVIPSLSSLKEFDYQTAPLFHKIILNIHESKTLAATRDLLLPKLMSGALRVAVATRVLEDAL